MGFFTPKNSSVRVKTLLLLPNVPSLRLFSVVDEFVSGAQLRCVGDMKDKDCRKIWDNPLYKSNVLPDIAARILAMEPIVGDDPVIGVESRNPEVKPIPASHSNSEDRQAIFIGKALGTSGLMRDINMSDADLRRHWQIVGQTGTGKSTLLAGTILETIRSGS